MKSSVKKLLALTLIIATQGSLPANADDWKGNIDKARTLLKQGNPLDAEMLLRTTLDQVKKAKHDQQYGRYMGLLGNALFEEKKSKEMIPYVEDALKTFYALPANEWPPANVFFTNHANLGMAYQSQGKIKQAEQQYYKAISIAEKIPKNQLDQEWLKLCFTNLIGCLKGEQKRIEVQKAEDQEKKMLGV